jgi:hypothetical protein
VRHKQTGWAALVISTRYIVCGKRWWNTYTSIVKSQYSHRGGHLILLCLGKRVHFDEKQWGFVENARGLVAIAIDMFIVVQAI